MKTFIPHDLSRRSVLKGLGLAAAGALSGASLSFAPARAADEFTVRMQLGWLASNGILGEVVADKLGYFADEGLRLEIVLGGPNIDGVAAIASGAANLGQLSSSPSLMMARSQGIPVKCVAAGYQKHPYTFFSLKKKPIRTPQDMVGKVIGTQATGRILLRALLAKNGIPEADVEMKVIGGDMTPLMTGQVDAITGWQTNIAALAVLGDERVDLMLWDAGIRLYANPYYVSDTVLAEHGDKLQATLRAIAKGWGYVHDNPEKAVEFLVERFPNLDKESELKAVRPIIGYSFNEETAKAGWGAMTRENWQAQIEIYDQLGQFEKGAPAIDDVMTLSVLEATAAARPVYG
ncbi:ABC transporter substrate-binding protein [Rhizobium sp. S95]|uniref:Thiamine pyrimidine synthase n=1 Tax=Ciceribacter sichuanensis TaxID=2949647 RepID=A0AAJ1F951_9HYPH|nr:MULTISPECIES: ABC transporter substrate-binding protein [unclassified Ciceribacter]MCM2395725.1 ABC transporter substrate-binding protein [Ciceribacter sp. S95]MCM2402474.1 ABC transporter substrate-binding protein [Ciceribacter sp. S153]MCO5958924.1 ABC transporter substrate-binding protein [Ciceribacter sp. S101]